MKVLVTGVKGQLGHDVVNELEKRGHTAVGVDIEEMDITDFTSVKNDTDSGFSGSGHSLCGMDSCRCRRRYRKSGKVHLVNAVGTENIAKCVNIWILPACIFQLTMYLTVRELTAGNRTVRTMHR